jgi:hypothetical protein
MCRGDSVGFKWYRKVSFFQIYYFQNKRQYFSTGFGSEKSGKRQGRTVLPVNRGSQKIRVPAPVNDFEKGGKLTADRC